jgi:hypothetical protein
MRYIFDDYILDTQRYELHRAGTRIHLRPKAFQVLAYLLAHRDRVVPKAELLEHVWPNQFIGDATLNSCIMAVRKALGDGGRTPRCLHTRCTARAIVLWPRWRNAHPSRRTPCPRPRRLLPMRSTPWPRRRPAPP